MPRSKKILTKQSLWTLILVAGFVLIYTGVQQGWFSEPTESGVVASVLSQANAETLEIPYLNISAPIIYSESTKESSIQKELQSGVVHLAGTSKPGEIGNAYIVGHSSNFKNSPGLFNEIFKDLPHIKKGDSIKIYQRGTELNFIVSETQIVESTELWVMSQATDGQKILTLQTSYPVGTAKQRFIVISKLDN